MSRTESATMPRYDPLVEAGRHRARARDIAARNPGVRRSGISAEIGREIMQAERLELQALDRIVEAAAAAEAIAAAIEDARRSPIARLGRRAAALKLGGGMSMARKRRTQGPEIAAQAPRAATWTLRHGGAFRRLADGRRVPEGAAGATPETIPDTAVAASTESET